MRGSSTTRRLRTARGTTPTTATAATSLPEAVPEAPRASRSDGRPAWALDLVLRRRQRRHAAAHPLEDDAGEDPDRPDQLVAIEVLAEDDQREHDREERLQVREQRRARRPDAADRREPEDVRQEERPDHRVCESKPGVDAEVEALARGLRGAGDGQRDPAEGQ